MVAPCIKSGRTPTPLMSGILCKHLGYECDIEPMHICLYPLTEKDVHDWRHFPFVDDDWECPLQCHNAPKKE